MITLGYFFLFLYENICCGYSLESEVLLMSTQKQGSGKLENSWSGPKIRILDRFQTPQNANNSVQQVCALNPIFFPTNQFSGINDV